MANRLFRVVLVHCPDHNVRFSCRLWRMSVKLDGRRTFADPNKVDVGERHPQFAIRAMHGYEINRAIEVRSNGFYVPSPGMIYPALAYLGEIGQAAVEQEGKRKKYRITAEGRQHLEANRASAEATLETY